MVAQQSLKKFIGNQTIKNLEPIIRNNDSGHDDNVESLTDNADGNDVGIKEILAANE